MTKNNTSSETTPADRVAAANERFKRRTQGAALGGILSLGGAASLLYGGNEVLDHTHMPSLSPGAEGALFLGAGTLALGSGIFKLAGSTRGILRVVERRFSPIGLSVDEMRAKHDELNAATAEAAHQGRIAQQEDERSAIATLVALGAGATAGGAVVYALAEAAQGRTWRAVAAGAAAGVALVTTVAGYQECARFEAAAHTARAAAAEQQGIAAAAQRALTAPPKN